MINLEATHHNLINWVQSPAFDPYFNSMVPKVRWRFIFGWLFVLSGAGIIIGIGLLIAGFRTKSARKKARAEAHTIYLQHQPMIAGIVIANRMLLQKKGTKAPALLVGRPGFANEEYITEVSHQAMYLCEIYGEDPSAYEDADVQHACATVNDDTYVKNRRRPSPSVEGLSNLHQLTLYDTQLNADLWGGEPLDAPFVVCLVAPGDTGPILQVPSHLVVWLADS